MAIYAERGDLLIAEFRSLREKLRGMARGVVLYIGSFCENAEHGRLYFF